MFHERDSLRNSFCGNARQQILQRRYVTHNQVPQETHLAAVFASSEFVLKCLYSRIKPGGRRRETAPEDRLKFFEPLVTERLCEAHTARCVNSTLFGDCVYRSDRYVVWVLRQVDRYLLIGVAHLRMAVMDNPDKSLIRLWRPSPGFLSLFLWNLHFL